MMLPTTTAIIPSNQVDLVQKLHMLVRELKDRVFVDGLDYGIIPGTGDKPTLLQPGMEKLCRALNCVPEYRERFILRDYENNIFHYEYEARLIDVDTGQAIPGGTGIGLATSRETKWRWREAKRVCPVCGKAAIIKGKPEYGGGWLCYKKQEGCGAKFAIDDKLITDQKTGRVENEDIADQLNTICKIAQKRALGSAIKGAANVSEFFTVDLEDLPQSDPTIITVEKPEPPAPKSNGDSPQSAPPKNSAAEKTADSTDELNVPLEANPGLFWPRAYQIARPAGYQDTHTQASVEKLKRELVIPMNATVQQALSIFTAHVLKNPQGSTQPHGEGEAGHSDDDPKGYRIDSVRRIRDFESWCWEEPRRMKPKDFAPAFDINPNLDGWRAKLDAELAKTPRSTAEEVVTVWNTNRNSEANKEAAKEAL